jgi:hypothetical protein
MRATHTTSSFLHDHVKNKHPGIPLNEKDAGPLEHIDDDMGTLVDKDITSSNVGTGSQQRRV